MTGQKKGGRWGWVDERMILNDDLMTDDFIKLVRMSLTYCIEYYFFYRKIFDITITNFLK